ncbi:MAG TPA: nucleic acid-binding protein, partial [Thermoplasmatales archaeon]|nr:nucleic acid-binding protein [Thermoplasmatales archaeon]
PISLDREMYTTPLVAAEFSPGGRFYRMFQFLLEAGLKIKKPSKDMIEIIRRKITETGDRLSEADIELLALALEFKGEDISVTILTDDYGIQNTADELDIAYQGIEQRGITKKFKWIWRCQGCGKVFMEKFTVCPVCGSKMKPIPYDIKSLGEK